MAGRIILGPHVLGEVSLRMVSHEFQLHIQIRFRVGDLEFFVAIVSGRASNVQRLSSYKE